MTETTVPRILIVDHEESVARETGSVLVAEGYEVFYAADGVAGLRIAHDEKPDLIILDPMIPKMDGYKLCRLLRFDERHKHIPVIMLGAFSHEHHIALGRESGASLCMIKPPDKKVILKKVHELLPARRRPHAMVPSVTVTDSEGEDFSAEKLIASANAKPIVRMVDAILARGIAIAASEIRIKPEHDRVAVRYRVKGALQDGVSLSRAVAHPVILRVKMISQLDIAEKPGGQPGYLVIHVDETEFRLRVSVLPCSHGEEIVISFTKGESSKILVASSNAKSIMRIVDAILARGIAISASQVRIKPEHDKVAVRYCVKNTLHEGISLPRPVARSVVARIKMVSHLDLTEKSGEQHGLLLLRVGEMEFALRVSAMPCEYGEEIIIGIIKKEKPGATGSGEQAEVKRVIRRQRIK